MRYRASFLSGLAAGYVLGARAGKERYEQIKRVARSAWQNPQVQRAADTVGTQAQNVVGSAARAAVDKGKAVTGKVSEKVGDKLPSRISDKLPAAFGRHHDDWQSYAHSGHNGHPGGPTSPPGTPGHL